MWARGPSSTKFSARCLSLEYPSSSRRPTQKSLRACATPVYVMSRGQVVRELRGADIQRGADDSRCRDVDYPRDGREAARTGGKNSANVVRQLRRSVAVCPRRLRAQCFARRGDPRTGADSFSAPMRTTSMRSTFPRCYCSPRHSGSSRSDKLLRYSHGGLDLSVGPLSGALGRGDFFLRDRGIHAGFFSVGFPSDDGGVDGGWVGLMARSFATCVSQRWRPTLRGCTSRSEGV